MLLGWPHLQGRTRFFMAQALLPSGSGRQQHRIVQRFERAVAMVTEHRRAENRQEDSDGREYRCTGWVVKSGTHMRSSAAGLAGEREHAVSSPVPEGGGFEGVGAAMGGQGAGVGVVAAE